MKLDYKRLGFRAGIEIHQQLNTSKLFCGCPSEIREDKPDIIVKRRMRAVAGEIGDVDPAALHEFLRGREFIYQAYSDTNCLVELDEEPPHLLNKEALEVALEISMLLNAEIVDEIHVMRKTVIDGSNTSGFQRTMLIAVDGYIDTKSGMVRIPTICLEEDAARKIVERDNITVYRLDRLGIPLIEIGTATDIKSPEHAREVAEKIGMILRTTGKVRRGIGTIRQDLNISIRGGKRIEIKGVQDLRLISKVIKNEIKRQLMLIDVKNKLMERGIEKDKLRRESIDVTDVFKKTESKIIRRKLEEGRGVFALPLVGFDGLLKDKLGPELSQYAKSVSQVKGIIHSDELPSYGISEYEVKELKKKLKLSDNDAFVIIIERDDIAKIALEKVFERCIMAFDGIPKETRRSTGNGATEFMRPLPGSARMYPETDEPLIKLDKRQISQIKKRLPKLPEELIRHYINIGLSEEMANQIIKSKWNTSFLDFVSEFDNIDPTLIATTLVSTPKEIKKRFSANIEKLREEHFRELFDNLGKGKIAKDSIPEILMLIIKNPERTIDDIIKSENMGIIPKVKIESEIDKIIDDNIDFVKSAKLKAAGPLTGMIIAKFRGRIDGKLVSSIIKKRIENIERGNK